MRKKLAKQIQTLAEELLISVQEGESEIAKDLAIEIFSLIDMEEMNNGRRKK